MGFIAVNLATALLILTVTATRHEQGDIGAEESTSIPDYDYGEGLGDSEIYDANKAYAVRENIGSSSEITDDQSSLKSPSGGYGSLNYSENKYKERAEDSKTYKSEEIYSNGSDRGNGGKTESEDGNGRIEEYGSKEGYKSKISDVSDTVRNRENEHYKIKNIENNEDVDIIYDENIKLGKEHSYKKINKQEATEVNETYNIDQTRGKESNADHRDHRRFTNGANNEFDFENKHNNNEFRRNREKNNRHILHSEDYNNNMDYNSEEKENNYFSTYKGIYNKPKYDIKENTGNHAEKTFERRWNPQRSINKNYDDKYSSSRNINDRYNDRYYEKDFEIKNKYRRVPGHSLYTQNGRRGRFSRGRGGNIRGRKGGPVVGRGKLDSDRRQFKVEKGYEFGQRNGHDFLKKNFGRSRYNNRRYWDTPRKFNQQTYIKKKSGKHGDEVGQISQSVNGQWGEQDIFDIHGGLEEEFGIHGGSLNHFNGHGRRTDGNAFDGFVAGAVDGELKVLGAL